jgi:hypothetical protein
MTTQEETKISIDTIARIFQEKSFTKPDTKIAKSTLKLTSEYIHLFINEAIVRANEQRLLEGDSLTKVDGIDNVSQKVLLTQVDADVSDNGDDIDIDEDPEDYHETNTQRQLSGAFDNTVSNDTLDSRHLAKIAGLLVLDF